MARLSPLLLLAAAAQVQRPRTAVPRRARTAARPLCAAPTARGAAVRNACDAMPRAGAGAAHAAARGPRPARGRGGDAGPGGRRRRRGARPRTAAARRNADGKGLADQGRSEENDHQREAEPRRGVVVQPSVHYALLVSAPVDCVRGLRVRVRAAHAACWRPVGLARTRTRTHARTHAHTHTRTRTHTHARAEALWMRCRFLACVITTVVSWDKLPIW